jgi:protein TonB
MTAAATSSRIEPLVAVRSDEAGWRSRRTALLAPDPLARVMTLGDRAVRVGLTIGIVLALGAHLTAAVRALSSLDAMLAVTREGRAKIHDFFWTTYDIDLSKTELPKPDEPPPPPEPEPEPEPAPKAPTPTAKADPYEQPAAPARAGAVLTQAPKDSDKIEDMTDGVVTGDGSGSGKVSAEGIGNGHVQGPAVIGGVPGGKGSGPPKPQAAPPPEGPDLSKPAGLSGGSGGNWNCPFPPEADSDSIDKADVVIRVTVKPDGSPASVSIVNDPGHGFGRAARICAAQRSYTAALDRSGAPVTQVTPNITVHFRR